MRNCHKCGSVQKHGRKTCSECGADLTLTSAQRDPFDLGLFGKILIGADILGVISAIAVMCIFIGDNTVNLSWCVMAIALFILAAIDTGIPEINRHFFELSMEFRHGISNDEPSAYYMIKWKLAVTAVPVICYIGMAAIYLPILI